MTYSNVVCVHPCFLCSSLTIVYPSVDDACGFNLNDSTHPMSVESVLPNSPAAMAGLQYGDELLMVNGHDVSRMPLSKIQSILSYSRCSPVTIKVVRHTENVSCLSVSLHCKMNGLFILASVYRRIIEFSIFYRFILRNQIMTKVKNYEPVLLVQS